MNCSALRCKENANPKKYVTFMGKPHWFYCDYHIRQISDVFRKAGLTSEKEVEV